MMIARAVQDEVAETFERIDGNGDRRISFAEFAQLMREIDHTRTDAALRREFSNVDRNADGHVSLEDFRAWMLPQGER